MRIWMMAAALLASPTAAAPVYLSCTIEEGGRPFPVELTLDEERQTATVLLVRTGRLVSRRAAFTPALVRIPDEMSTWAIDRVTLDFKRIFEIGDNAVEYGRCTIQPAPAKRAF